MEKEIPLQVIILCSLFPLFIYSHSMALMCLTSCVWKTSLKLECLEVEISSFYFIFF